jgi:hypothetical protein
MTPCFGIVKQVWLSRVREGHEQGFLAQGSILRPIPICERE